MPVSDTIEAIAEQPDDNLPVEMVNLSTSGTAIVAAAPLGEVGNVIGLRFRDNKDSDWQTATFRLRYILGEGLSPGRESRWLHGGEFKLLPERTWAFVSGVVESHLSSQADGRTH